MTDPLTAALYSIPSDDRETWVRIGMAIKSEFGDSGFRLWDQWSRQSEPYRAPDAKAVWRSIKANGGITIATLYHEAKAHGWQGEAPARPQVGPDEKRQRAEELREEERRRKERANRAALGARTLMETAVYGEHEYLARKGFPAHRGLIAAREWPENCAKRGPTVRVGDLIIPVWHHRTGRLQLVQRIDAKGDKRFLPGGKAGGGVHRLGRGLARWYCEGYATGLSVQAALRRLYRRDEVVVCFSSQNLPAPACYDWWPEGYVIADHDLHSCPRCRHRWDGAWESCCPVCGNTSVTMPAGEKYARETRLPYWMSERPGDANDYHQQYGVEALADALRGVLNWTGRVETLSIR